MWKPVLENSEEISVSVTFNSCLILSFICAAVTSVALTN